MESPYVLIGRPLPTPKWSEERMNGIGGASTTIADRDGALSGHSWRRHLPDTDSTGARVTVAARGLNYGRLLMLDACVECAYKVWQIVQEPNQSCL